MVREARWLGVSLITVAAVSLWLAALVHFDYGGNWTALFSTGDRLPVPPELAPGTYIWKGTSGYDGEFYRYVAHDPFFRNGYARFIDLPRTRYRRILLPGLAYLLAAGRRDWIDTAYLLLELATVGLGVYWAAAYLATQGRHPLWGASFLLVPAVLASFDRMLPDGLVAALFVAFLYHSERGAWRNVYAVILFAGLARETGLLLVAGTVAFSLWRKVIRRALLFSTAALPALLWYVFVAAHTASGEPGEMLAWPGVGLVRRLFTLRGATEYALLIHILDALAMLGFILCILLALRWIWIEPVSSGGLTVALFACLAVVSGSPAELVEAYGYSRPAAPLLAFVLLRAIASGVPLGLLPPLMVSLSVAASVFSVSRIMGILKGL